MRRADIRELLEYVGVRLQAVGRDFTLGEEGEAVIDDVVGENAPVGKLRGLRRIETEHVGQDAVLIDRGDRFLAGVVAGVPDQVDELIEPALAIGNRLARVVLLFGLFGVGEAADRGMPRALYMNHLSVAAHPASPP